MRFKGMCGNTCHSGGISKTRILFWGGVGGLENSPEGLHCEKMIKKGFETKYDSNMTGFLTGVLKNIIGVCIKLCRSFYGIPSKTWKSISVFSFEKLQLK